MAKIKLAVICGGMSTEHNVSIVSADTILKNLNRKKYDVYPIYIDKDGKWYEFQPQDMEIKVGDDIEEKSEISNVMEYLKKLDIVFPVLHGLYGEDGTIQGLCELLGIKYVGCKVLASSIGMDKVYSKIVFEKAGLNQANYEYIKVYKSSDQNMHYIYVDKKFNEKEYSLEKICDLVVGKLNYPLFIKPSNSGSSIGVSKAKTYKELQEAIIYAANFDEKILIEEGINGRELECAVLGNKCGTKCDEKFLKSENQYSCIVSENKDTVAACVGEVKSAEESYTYDAKYKNEDSKTVIPAMIPENISSEIRRNAIRAFKAIDGKGLSRVDFFLEKDTNKIYINEINTLPGFTAISMYPKLFEASGIDIKQLIEAIIDLEQ